MISVSDEPLLDRLRAGDEQHCEAAIIIERLTRQLLTTQEELAALREQLNPPLPWKLGPQPA